MDGVCHDGHLNGILDGSMDGQLRGAASSEPHVRTEGEWGTRQLKDRGMGWSFESATTDAMVTQARQRWSTFWLGPYRSVWLCWPA